MKNFGVLAVSLLLSTQAFPCTQDGAGGFLPENNWKIPVNAKRLGGLTEAQFNASLDKVETLYAPIVASMGATLKVIRNWSDPTVNAYAQQVGKEWKVSMFGGLARHETITEDGMSLVICHEFGHHIGGAPKKVSPWSNPWASNEGQSDYFATSKCLRRAWMSENNEEIVAAMASVPASLTQSCQQQWTTPADQAMCVRGGMAGLSVAKLFQALSSESKEPMFDTPDAKQVTATIDYHPATQCRLDTYLQGALCEKAFSEDFENASEVTGSCHGSVGHTIGLRPLCWFKPKP